MVGVLVVLSLCDITNVGDVGNVHRLWYCRLRSLGWSLFSGNGGVSGRFERLEWCYYVL